MIKIWIEFKKFNPYFRYYVLTFCYFIFLATALAESGIALSPLNKDLYLKAALPFLNVTFNLSIIPSLSLTTKVVAFIISLPAKSISPIPLL